MSSTYQEYSGKRKLRIDENTEDYLKEQIQHYKEKSAKSMKLAQEFAIDQDLFYFERDSRNGNVLNPNIQTLRFANTNDSLLPENVSIENIRVAAANELRELDLQLEKIEKLNDLEELRYVGSSIQTLNDSRNTSTY